MVLLLLVAGCCAVLLHNLYSLTFAGRWRSLTRPAGGDDSGECLFLRDFRPPGMAACDLLPLYCDDVCSQDSRAIVEEHLRDCPDCRGVLQKMKTEYRLASGVEQEQEEMVRDMATRWRKTVKKSFCRGMLITACACLILMGGYLALTRLILIPVPLDSTQAAVGNVSEECVEISLRVTDGKKVSLASMEITEDGKCFILLKRGLIPQSNSGDEPWSGEWAVSSTGVTDSGERVLVREIYCGSEDRNFLIWQAE